MLLCGEGQLAYSRIMTDKLDPGSSPGRSMVVSPRSLK